MISEEKIERAEQAEQVWHECRRQLENRVASEGKTINRSSKKYTMNERNKRITKEEEGKDTKRKRRERLKGFFGSVVKVVSCMQKTKNMVG